ncbi:histone-fold-containing protein [Hysterangium stoloniferum]|nr:histone-fold-containing protein [Hysterangium stoloniferum]
MDVDVKASKKRPTKSKHTKFPVARIKKIMQKDEDVGKVAQATPVVICTLLRLLKGLAFLAKALELFLGNVVEEAYKVSISRNAKRVEPYHLKHAILNTPLLDFLKDLVEAVPDPSNGGTIDESEVAPKKRTRGKGKAKAKSEPELKEEVEEGDEDSDYEE